MKIFGYLLSGMVAFGLAGCGSDSSSPKQSTLPLGNLQGKCAIAVDLAGLGNAPSCWQVQNVNDDGLEAFEKQVCESEEANGTFTADELCDQSTAVGDQCDVVIAPLALSIEIFFYPPTPAQNTGVICDGIKAGIAEQSQAY